jgi:hypothetical protein
MDMANLSNMVATVNQKNPDSGIPSRVSLTMRFLNFDFFSNVPAIS